MDPTQNQQNPANIAQPGQQTPKQEVSQPPQAQTGLPMQRVVLPPTDPISTPRKESGPMVTAPVSEYLKPTDLDPVLHPELEKAGVEVSKNHEVPNLSEQVKTAGVTHSGPVQQVVVSDQPVQNFPLTQQKAIEVEKKKNWHESLSWLAIFVLRQLKIIEAEKKKE